MIELTKYKSVTIRVDESGVFSAVDVGPAHRVVRGATLEQLKAQIDAVLEDAAGERRKDVSIPVRLLLGGEIVDATYLGVRANGSHMIRVTGEDKPVELPDYVAMVIPDSVPPEDLASYTRAAATLADVKGDLEAARRRLRLRRAPTLGYVPTTLNTERLREQNRFVAELLKIKGG